MRQLLCTVLLSVTVLPGLASAEIYRWTDAQGQVHFDQRPQAGAEQVEVKPQVVERDAATREREARTERFYDARRQEQEQATSQSSERQAKREQECSKLRDQLEQVSQGGRYYHEDAAGQRVYYSDAEISAVQRQLRERVVQRCG
ncbi:DUF4124 domain-containing protein [Pseudomonas cavernae]|uniref:DUF4124 domain-containing protein n=1 Tax=Pseudomonas cavernae TaxID=2320867 RepID=A0A385Z4Q3_9PSED|nr:DUF4124 domain-containing protein [Pseudomonas cavernae]AYC34116.1 DUF4124 domain-containing protein [Pseudomonas cavernae]